MSMSTFIDFHYQNLSSNKKKTATSVFVQLLDMIVASCDLSETETSESNNLLNANNFFKDIQERIRNHDYKPSVVLMDVTSYITSLDSLKQEAVKYEDSLYICNRIDSFVSELNNILTNLYDNEQQKKKKKFFIYAIIALLAVFFVRDCSCSCGSNSVSTGKYTYTDAVNHEYTLILKKNGSATLKMISSPTSEIDEIAYETVRQGVTGTWKKMAFPIGNGTREYMDIYIDGENLMLCADGYIYTSYNAMKTGRTSAGNKWKKQ